MKATRNQEMLDNLTKNCSEKRDTLFAIYTSKDGDTANYKITFTGDEKDVAIGLAELVRDAIKKGANRNSIRLGDAFLNSISMILEKRDNLSEKFAVLLSLAILGAKSEESDYTEKTVLEILSHEETKENSCRRQRVKPNRKKNGKA